MIQNPRRISIKVRFYASLRERLGIDERTLKLDKNTSFASLVDELKEDIGEGVNVIVDNEGSLRGNVILSVNNRLIRASDLTKLKLGNGDTVALMPLPSGG